jgi:hypothetical protein
MFRCPIHPGLEPGSARDFSRAACAICLICVRARQPRHSQRDPILIYEGQILDGRNRYRACMIAGVDAKFATFDRARDGDPLAYVRNLRRRHRLTERVEMLSRPPASA